MREILFRGKRVDNGEWVYGFYVPVNYAKPLIVTGADIDDYSEIEFDDYYHVNDTTVGQFTGLTDKNGKKIFEGDIIHVNYTISVPVGAGPLLRIVKHSIDYKSVVAFENCRFCLKKQNGEIFEMHLVPGEVEVIGNIHDNPELLEAYK